MKIQKKGLKPFPTADRNRRAFLVRSFQWTAAALIPAPLRPFGDASSTWAAWSEPTQPPSASEYHLTPHYRLQTPLDDLLRYVKPGLDAFVTEKYAEEVSATLAAWTAHLLESPWGTAAIENSLSENFAAASLHPTVRQPARSGSLLEIHRNNFSDRLTLGKQQFIAEMQAWLRPFSQILTAEFKVTGISEMSHDSQVPAAIKTRIRYDFVGSSADSYRVERIGHWELEWESKGAGEWRIRKWRPAGETESRAQFPVFVDVTEAAFGKNRSYRAQLLRGSDYWRTVLDGASHIDVYGNNGIAAGDVDQDGFDELYICQPAGLPNRLYRNRGDGTFEDITEAAGVGVLDNTSCALCVDVDNDGAQDLVVVTVDGPLLFLNQGSGRFRLKPDAFRFARPPQGTFTGAAACDYDRDGRLDFYFCLYSYYQGLNQYQFPSPYYDARNGPPNFLMHNRGDGTFRDVTEASGVNQNNDRYSFTCEWTDYNNDGWPDLYVVNDFGQKNLYRNQGDGTFTDVAAEAGVEDVGAGMSVCWFDADLDGFQDLYVADMWSAAGERVTAQSAFTKNAPPAVRALLRKHARGNSLFRNQRNGRFADASAVAGVEMGRWSWSSYAWDFDHDGFPDLYIANGMISGPNRHDLSSFFWRQVVAKTPVGPALSHSYEQGWNAINELIRSDGTWAGDQRNNFYANQRDGTFSEVSGAVGLDFNEDSRTFALADLDHDGRLELVLKNRSGPQIRVLKNAAPNLGSSIAFRLRGTKSNRDAIGALITAEAGALRQSKFLQAGGGFLAQHSKDIFFGLGEETGPVRATIRWPNGAVQRLEGLPPGHRIVIEEGSAQFRADPFQAYSPAAPRASVEAPREPPLPDTSETWLLAPVAAPAFSLPDTAGRTYSLASFFGKPLLLNFWAMESASSIEQLARFNRRPTLQRAGIQLIALNVDDAKQASRIRSLAREKRFWFSVLLATEDMAAVYNILFRYLFDRRSDLAIPSSFLIDEQGVIVKVYQGPADPQRVEEDARHIPATFAERLRRGLPFTGDWYAGEPHRNQFTYAWVFLERGYLDQAAAACRLLLAREPENAEAHYMLGMVYLKKQMAAEARASFERTLHARPVYPDTWPDAWNNLGMLAAQSHASEEAIRDFKEALRLNPQYVVALENLGNVYRQLGRWDEAQTRLEEAVKAEPDDPVANYSLGMVFAQKDDSGRAEEYLLRALRFQPDYPEALNNLGILYVRTRRIDEAVAAFEKCIQIAPQFDQAYLNLAKIYVVEDETEKAREILRRLLAVQPNDAAAQKALQELSR